MSDTASSIKIDATTARQGGQGERCLASGQSVGLRMWNKEEPGAPKPATRRPYETVGYVLSGRADLTVEGRRVTLEPGSSYLVPKNALHEYHIIETLTAIEATSPPADPT